MLNLQYGLAVSYTLITITCNVLYVVTMLMTVLTFVYQLIRARLLFQEHPVHIHTWKLPNLLVVGQLLWSTLELKALLEGLIRCQDFSVISPLGWN